MAIFYQKYISRVIPYFLVCITILQLVQFILPVDDQGEFSKRKQVATIEALENSKILVADITVRSIKIVIPVDNLEGKNLKNTLSLSSSLENLSHKLYFLCLLDIENDIQSLQFPQTQNNFRSPPVLSA